VARKEQRPPRRYYELTAGGRGVAGEARAKAQAMAQAGKRLLRPAESEG
jgi:DNA-binding PadR family transcriptional regulator